MKLIYTLGLPGSGKSSWARARQQHDPTLVLVSRDDLRAMLHSGKWSKRNEKQVVAIQDSIIRQALKDGRSVIVADTNFHPSNRLRFDALAAAYGATVEVEDFTHIPVDKCIENDLKRLDSVGEQVIRRMWRDYLRPQPPVPVWNPLLPNCIIVDMDGTLAEMNGRSPYDETGLCIDDTCHETIAKIVRLQSGAATVIIMSGRFGTEANVDATVRWLNKHRIPFAHLYMREPGDNRKDSIIKEELFRAHVDGVYNVLYAIDDRQQVVDLWRSLGLTCLQCAEGAF